MGRKICLVEKVCVCVCVWFFHLLLSNVCASHWALFFKCKIVSPQLLQFLVFPHLFIFRCKLFLFFVCILPIENNLEQVILYDGIMSSNGMNMAKGAGLMSWEEWGSYEKPNKKYITIFSVEWPTKIPRKRINSKQKLIISVGEEIPGPRTHLSVPLLSSKWRNDRRSMN